MSNGWSSPYKISTQAISFSRSRSFIRVRCLCSSLSRALCFFLSLFISSVWHFGRQIRFWLKHTVFFFRDSTSCVVRCCHFISFFFVMILFLVYFFCFFSAHICQFTTWVAYSCVWKVVCFRHWECQIDETHSLIQKVLCVSYTIWSSEDQKNKYKRNKKINRVREWTKDDFFSLNGHLS